VVVPKVRPSPIDHRVARRAVDAEVFRLVRSVVGDYLENVVYLKLLGVRKLVSMAQTDLATVAKIAQLLSTLSSVRFRGRIWEPDPVNPGSTCPAINAGEMRAPLIENELELSANASAMPTSRRRKLCSDGVSMKLHARSMVRVIHYRNPRGHEISSSSCRTPAPQIVTLKGFRRQPATQCEFREQG
jgi:hypothetical protein